MAVKSGLAAVTGAVAVAIALICLPPELRDLSTERTNVRS
jgi:hypothetical protein